MMTATITPSELAERTRKHSLVRINARSAERFLRAWQAQGIAHEVTPGEWQLTKRGRAMFAGFTNVGSVTDDTPGGHTPSRSRAAVPHDLANFPATNDRDFLNG